MLSRVVSIVRNKMPLASPNIRTNWNYMFCKLFVFWSLPFETLNDIIEENNGHVLTMTHNLA